MVVHDAEGDGADAGEELVAAQEVDEALLFRAAEEEMASGDPGDAMIEGGGEVLRGFETGLTHAENESINANEYNNLSVPLTLL